VNTVVKRVAAKSNLIPIQELTPGAIAAIRNQIINKVVDQACKAMNMSPDNLVVRDINPVVDLQMYSAGTTAATIEEWVYTATTGTGYVSFTGAQTMADQRFMAIWGIRDMRFGLGPHATASAGVTGRTFSPLIYSLMKINVGGADKIIWDLTCMVPYTDNLVALSTTGIIIPQNIAYNLSLYKTEALTDIPYRFQPIGCVVEPRGKRVSP